MKFLIILSCLFYTAFTAVVQDVQWVQFKAKHEKTYSSIQEEQLRFSIFQQNLKTIQEHNLLYEAGQKTYQMGVNKFADWTREEYLQLLKRQSKTRPKLQTGLSTGPSIQGEVPDSIDWRDVGAVSEVKDQGGCGSCWAFSAIGTVESFNYLKNKKLVTFSEQQLVDCDTSNYGCSGGEEGPALDYIKTYGIQSEESYPYEGKESFHCHYNQSASSLKIKNHVQIPEGDENALLEAVGLLGPVSVALDAMGLTFYEKGVFTDNSCSKDSTNHAVLAVGYGFDESSGQDYWLIKNSWGEDWGEAGYFKLLRGVNECAIAHDNVYPIL